MSSLLGLGSFVTVLPCWLMTNFTLFVCLFVTKCNSSGQDYLLCNFNRVTARQWSIQLPATLPNSPRYVKNLQFCLFGVWGVTAQSKTGTFCSDRRQGISGAQHYCHFDFGQKFVHQDQNRNIYHLTFWFSVLKMCGIVLLCIQQRHFQQQVLPNSKAYSLHFHYMMFLTIQTTYFLWGYDPGTMSVSFAMYSLLSWAQFTVV